jgi:hypothetical protein
MASAADTLLKRHIALTNEHGSWALLLSPLLIGLFAGGRLTLASFFLIAAALSAFLIRHPVIILVKIHSGRRGRRDLVPAVFWASLYGILGLAMVLGLSLLGFAYLLLLAFPGVLIFGWQLWLVSRRSERRQMGIEIVGSGVLALTAPAAMWVGLGAPARAGWLLWLLVWAQSAASIVYAYLRLEQRELKAIPARAGRFRMARRALAYTTFNLAAVLALSLLDLLPALLWIPYALQWGETLWGASHPAIGWRPTAIGMRQMIVTGIFTLLFILAW